MLTFKLDVNLVGINSAMSAAWSVANEVFQEFGLDVCQVNDAVSFNHSEASLHNSGNAIDIDTHDGPRDNRVSKFSAGVSVQLVADTIADRLPADFDVIFHDTHIHIEFQPKRSNR